MKKRTVIIVGIVFLSLVFSSVAYAKYKDPFVGVWEKTDLDFSHEWKWIEYLGAGVYEEIYYDNGCSACCDEGSHNNPDPCPPCLYVASGFQGSEYNVGGGKGSLICLGRSGDVCEPWLHVFELEMDTEFDPATGNPIGWDAGKGKPEKVIDCELHP